MSLPAGKLAPMLARDAEVVCRTYLSNGRREGRYWRVGDAANTPGRSLFVRLSGPATGKGAAGRWTDAATGDYGDLLDIIRESCGLRDFADVAEEAMLFLRLPSSSEHCDEWKNSRASAPGGSIHAGRRMFAMSQPITNTLAESYLRRRGVTNASGLPALRFHSRCYYRHDPDQPAETWPALIAAVTDLSGAITGVQRTYVDPSGFSERALGKAPIETPRKSLGSMRGHGVRFGNAQDVLAVGEGIETVLSVRQALPALPMVSTLSAANLAAIVLPSTVRRLYILCDADAAGQYAARVLAARAREQSIDAIPLLPRREDFNEDLLAFHVAALRRALRTKLAPEDVARFLVSQSAPANP